MGAFGVVILRKVFPEFLSEGGAFSKHKEGEDEGENKDSKEAADSANGCTNDIAKIADHLGRKFLNDLIDLVLEIGDAEAVTNLIDEANVASSVIDESRKITEETNRLIGDGRDDDGGKSDDEANDENIGNSNGEVTTLGRENIGDFFDEWRNRESKEESGKNDGKAKASFVEKKTGSGEANND